MPRLDKERQERLEPKRMTKAKEEITRMGYEIHFSDDKCLKFRFKGEEITYWVYSGWASGKTIKDGRGLKNLLNQINESWIKLRNLVESTEKKVIPCVATKRENDFIVELEQDGGIWECGETLEKALDKMKVSTKSDFLIVVY